VLGANNLVINDMQIYKWSSAEKIAEYLGKDPADEEKINWFDSIMGIPLVALDEWKPPVLEQYLGENKKRKSLKLIGDAPVSGPVIIISELAANALRDIWDRHAVLYPVILSDDKEHNYYMVVVQTVLDCLDREKSTGPKQKYGPTPDLFASVETWVFDEGCIGDVDLFVLPDSKTAAFVSERFRQRVIKAGLKGFCLKKEFWEEDPWVS
jgi:hypothetical protein